MSCCIGIGHCSNLNIYGGSFICDNGWAAVFGWSSGASVNIYDGTFKADGTYGPETRPTQALFIDAVNTQEPGSKMAPIWNIRGGDFTGPFTALNAGGQYPLSFTVSGGSFTQDPSAYVPENCKVT